MRRGPGPIASEYPDHYRACLLRNIDACVGRTYRAFGETATLATGDRECGLRAVLSSRCATVLLVLESDWSYRRHRWQ
jgi:hypothetical protein